MRLRVAVVGAAAVALVAGILLAITVTPLFAQLAVSGAVVLLGVLFEARRYRTRSTAGRWQDTDERFIDPSTGHLVQVRFNPQTGERDYVDLGPQPAGPA